MIMTYVAWKFVDFIGNNTIVVLRETVNWLYDFTGSCLVYSAATMLRLFGQEVIFYKRMITLNTSAGYYLTNTQIMIAPFVTLTGTAICLLNFKNAVKTLAVGLSVIFLLNTLLIVVLAKATLQQVAFVLQTGNGVFTLLTYVFIFLFLHQRIAAMR